MEIWKPLEAGSCRVADSEEEGEEEREKEGMPHDCHNDFNICACERH